MIIMLRLKNVKIGNKYAEADFYPENSLQVGHIVVDLSTREIVSCISVPGYGPMYEGHARQGLTRMADEGDTTSERLVMWY